MATINLGNIKFNWQGAYNGATAYAVDDVVSYNGSSYICKLASTGNLPTNTTYWDQMSAKGTDGTNGTDLTTTLTTQGDLVYRDGSGLQRLGAGTAGQVLQTGGAGANPSWGTVSSDYVKLFTTSGSSLSQIQFDGYFSSTYKYYKILMTEIQNSTDGQVLYLRFNSTTATPDTSGNYKYVLDGGYQSSSASAYDRNSGWNATQMMVTHTWADSARRSALDLTISAVTDGSTDPQITGLTSGHDNSYYFVKSIAGSYSGTGNPTGMTFFSSSGTITVGNFTLYGIK